MIHLKQVGISYNSKTILLPADLALDLGNFICLIGRNGSGKSSLLRCLANLRPLHQGQLLLANIPYSQYSAKKFAQFVSIVNTNRIDFPYLSVKELVSLGRHPYLGFGGQLKATDYAKIDQALALVQMDHLSNHLLEHCSDGERQKTMLARALTQDTSVLLLDEITAHLDFVHRHQTFQLLQKLAVQENKLIIMATHELDLALHYSHQIMIIHHAQLHNYDSSDPQAKELLHHIFEGIF